MLKVGNAFKTLMENEVLMTLTKKKEYGTAYGKIMNEENDWDQMINDDVLLGPIKSVT